MASSTLSNWASKQIMDFVLQGAAAPTLPANLYLALFTTTPTLGNTGGVEVSTTGGTGYARVPLLRADATWNDFSGGNDQLYTNAQELVFPIPTANWGTIVSLGIFDASTAGNLLFISTITTSKPIQVGDGAARVLAGQLRILRASC